LESHAYLFLPDVYFHSPGREKIGDSKTKEMKEKDQW